VPSPAYRIPAPPPPPPPREAQDEASRLGEVRSHHGAPPLWRALIPAAAISILLPPIVVATGQATELGVWAICLATMAVVFAVFAWSPLRQRRTHVTLCARGLVVEQRGARGVIPFEDVDEVWYDLDTHSNWIARFSTLHALRLVEPGGRAHRVPLTVQAPWQIVAWVQRHCSQHLLPQARRALRSGETLTFGAIRIDATGLAFGSTRVAWSDVRFVRMQSGRLAFFRRAPIFPWKTVSLDSVPHPFVFASLVRELAQRVEVDNPFAASSE
jgi:hypothetical protein